MIEYNSETANKLEELHPTIKTPEPAQVTEAELQARVESLETNLAERTRDRDYWFDKYLETKRFIQASIDREEWTTEELSEPYWEELAELLNLDLKLEREITVTVTWNLTVKGKTDLSSWDFNVAIEPDSGSLEILNGDSCPDIDISED